MFYNLIKRNSRADRKENSIYFVSMMIAVMAFYVILSLENLDVLRFIRTMESDAIGKLLTLVPVLYGFSLCIIFFLVFFTARYQMERRNHELGMYLMMGMKRSRLFFMLLAEDMVNTLLSLLLGIPAAVLFSEIVSLTVSRIVGTGILGHRFSISLSAVLWTAGGLLLVKIGTLGILSAMTVYKQPYELMKNSTAGREKKKKKPASIAALAAGILLLSGAYAMALSVRYSIWESLGMLAAVLASGVTGTFLLFKGIYTLFEILLKRQKKRSDLGSFTLRQVQESVFLKNGSLATASLLALIAFCCLGFGVSAVMAEKPEHLMDYTFTGEEKEIREVLEETGVMEKFQSFYPMRTAYLPTDMKLEGEIKKGLYQLDTQEFTDQLRKQEASEAKERALNDFGEDGYLSYPHILSISDYNELLQAAGEEEIALEEGEMLLYANKNFTTNGIRELLLDILKEDLHVYLNGQPYKLKEQMAEHHIVTDSSITLAYGLVLPDALFEEITEKTGSVSTYWNGVLRKDFTGEKGLIPALSQVNETLNQAVDSESTGVFYESYMQNIGRHLFYIIAESYTTLYLGIIFLVIANTVLSTQYLMHQRRTGKRYQTLTALGGSFQSLSKSAKTQIRWYFFMPVLTAAVSAVFGVASSADGLLSSYFKIQGKNLVWIGILVLAVICVVEYLYMTAVMRVSNRNIRELMLRKRDEN